LLTCAILQPDRRADIRLAQQRRRFAGRVFSDVRANGFADEFAARAVLTGRDFPPFSETRPAS